MGPQGTVHVIDWSVMTAAELDAELEAVLAGEGKPATVVFCAAVPEARQAMLHQCLARRYPKARMQWLKVYKRRAGVRPAYADTGSFGVDRYAALVGAKGKYPNTPVIIIDLGTAITIDAMDGSGQHLGGLIMPGLGSLRDSLYEKAPHLRNLPVSQEHQLPKTALMPTNTSDAIEVGIHVMLTASIERIVSDLCAELPASPQIILCGGDAERMAKLFAFEAHIEPELVLDGMLVLSRL